MVRIGLVAALALWANQASAEGLFDHAERCLATAPDRSSCFSAIQCETGLFQSRYGSIEGAGAGWCAAKTRLFWLDMTDRAEKRFTASCLQSGDERDVFADESRAWSEYVRKRCELDYTGPRWSLQAMRTSLHTCFRKQSLLRIDDMIERQAECTTTRGDDG